MVEFEFVNEANLEEVIATFAHEDGDHEIELVGEAINSVYPQQEVPTAVMPRRLQYGKVSLQATVTGDDPPGEYTCKKITASTAGAKRLDFEERLDEVKFIVALEPTRSPHIVGNISLGTREVTFPARVYDQEKDDYLETSDRPL